MGIRGLNTFLKKKALTSYQPLNWHSSDFAGQKWGVDAQCLLHRARGDGLSPLTVIAALIVRIRCLGVEPIFIFDGRPPSLKEEIVTARRVVRQEVQQEISQISTEITDGTHTEVEKIALQTRVDVLQKKAPQITHKERNDIKSFLYMAGVLHITATGEADDVLSHLCRTDFLQAVISTDMDMLARRVPRLIMPETPDASIMTIISLSGVLSALRLTYEQFVEACVLMGCDYTEKKWVSWAPHIAVAAVASGSIKDLKRIQNTGHLLTAAATLRGDGHTWSTMVSEKQQAKWLAGAPIADAEGITALCINKHWPTDWMPVLVNR